MMTKVTADPVLIVGMSNLYQVIFVRLSLICVLFRSPWLQDNFKKFLWPTSVQYVLVVVSQSE
jgi:hypothetical protein